MLDSNEFKLKPLVIAIDGYSSCGKSTLAKDVAVALGLQYVDTGAMYRAVTLYFLQNNFSIPDEQSTDSLAHILRNISVSFKFNALTNKSEITLNGQFVDDEIRSMKVSDSVSKVSALKEVRTFLIEQQQAMGSNGGVVMDGRDIGTAVFPDADLKFFMTAKPEIRAQRRFDELKNKNIIITFEAVLENIEQRDYLDTTRKIHPLIKAPDAIVLDNSNMSRKTQLEFVLNTVQKLQSVSTNTNQQ
jgi:cytidylate kinase